jgi:hypothetical protein
MPTTVTSGTPTRLSHRTVDRFHMRICVLTIIGEDLCFNDCYLSDGTPITIQETPLPSFEVRSPSCTFNVAWDWRNLIDRIAPIGVST